MTDGDDKLARRYRELAREEPGAALDAAILAASRRPARRASFASRWAAPVSIAAVLVLAFGLTLEMRQEEPGVETSVPAPRREAPPPVQRAEPAEKPKPLARERLAPAEPQPKTAPQAFPAQSAGALKAPAAAREEKVPVEAPREETRAPSADLQRAPAAAPPPASPPAAGAARIAPESLNPAPAARAKSLAAPAAQSPVDAELERIAGLRAQGRDAEADAALEQFRRDHPGYTIPDAMWDRVKPR